MKWIFNLLLIPLLAFTNANQSFFENEDATLFHHVNVITGNLNISFKDARVEGAEPILIPRTYSSAGALERTRDDFDLLLKGIRAGWIVQGGWSFLPHTHLLIEPPFGKKDGEWKVFLPEPNGNMITYTYSHCPGGSIMAFKPTNRIASFSGKLNSRTNVQNNLLLVDVNTEIATLLLPDGGKRIYRGPSLRELNATYSYLLEEEKRPNGRCLRYTHEKKTIRHKRYEEETTHLKRIESTNPDGNKVYASVDIDYIESKKQKPYEIKLKTSDGKQLHYKTLLFEDRQYINEMQSTCHPHEKFHFIPGRKGIGARVFAIDLAGKELFSVEYYLPRTMEQHRKWAKKPEQKEFHIDKVEKILAPVGMNGEKIAIATFSYFRQRTDVRDSDGLLIRFHHDSDRLTLIEYFDEKDQLCSSQKFYWDESKLCCKALFDEKQRPLFAKTFAYDGQNVVVEVLWGSLTGHDVQPLYIDSTGHCSGAECSRKTYSYYTEQCNLLQSESEEEGPTYEYFYKEGTDLCTAKFTKDQTGQILIREFSFYDDNNLVIREVVDDGVTIDPDEIKGVTQRLEKQYIRNPDSDLTEWLVESYWDPLEKKQKLLKKIRYTYLNQRVHQEEIFDALENSRYTITTDYDTFGAVKRKTTPLGRENTYCYNAQDCLIESKEVGSAKKQFTYDQANRLIACEEPDTGKIATTSYDPKGRILAQTDFRGNQTLHTYDCFGNRKTTQLPSCKDERDEIYSPILHFDYDIQGNLIATKTLLNEKTESSYTESDSKIELCQGGALNLSQRSGAEAAKHNMFSDAGGLKWRAEARITAGEAPVLHFSGCPTPAETIFESRAVYNLFRKPILSSHPDGTHIRHFYNKTGTLKKTVHSDGTEVRYEHDLLKRQIGKAIYSKEGKCLLSEKWEYNSFQLLSYTDQRGLTTRFTYDGAGRKLSEEAETRKITFTYDPLGFLEKTDYGAFALIQQHNVEGLVEEQWEEDLQGRIEKGMQFFYDSENRKEKAIRKTSQGEAIDLFGYQNGKLSSHTDPHGNRTTFVLNDFYKNELGQYVSQKTITDPLGQATIETYDVGERIVSREKKNAQNQTVFKERFLYDVSGNQAKRISYVYNDCVLSRETSIIWKHDPMGRIKEETESDQKSTLYDYDSKGRLACKTLPDGTRLNYVYDGADRLEELSSSDGKIHYRYLYGLGPDSIQISDLVQNMILSRQYNLFGQVISETNNRGALSTWNYDSNGRCTTFILPDGSSVAYSHQGKHMTSVRRKDSEGTLRYEHCYRLFDCNGHVIEEDRIFNLGPIFTTYDLFERPHHQSSDQLEHSIAYGPSGLVNQTENSLFGKKTYKHDATSQLQEEGEQSYHFDSLGNPIEAEVNQLNQISTTPECTFAYDENGNLQRKTFSDSQIEYQFDPLGRLIEITTPQQRKVHYFYDPLSRLYAKEAHLHIDNRWKKESKIFYLYDRDREIGIQEEDGTILELKTLGLGIRGDIGAAVALEIGKEVYAPLHDFNGNLIAIVSPQGQIVEKYEISAFGQEKSSSHINPWRFSSKRAEEGLIFFGLRFYDPSLGRWLTPDPAGYTDGANLYVFVQNSPLNRLDLFGLFAEDPFTPVQVYIPIPTIPLLPGFSTLLGRGAISGVEVDFVICCGHWHQLQFAPEEIQLGQLDIMNHLHELTPTEGQYFGLVTVGNGIDTSLKECFQMSAEVGREVGDTLLMALYNPTEGVRKDIKRTKQERAGVETPIVCLARQFMATTGEKLYNINPQSLWLCIPHSENGVITKRAIEGMTETQQNILKEILHIYAVAPAEPLPKSQGASVINVYSEKDYVTGFGPFGYANSYMNHPDYDVRVLSCQSNMWHCNLFIADHGFLQPTYRKAWTGHIDQLKEKFNFYGGLNESTR